MGVKIKDLIPGKTITVSALQNKVLAVDAFNMLYQFITTIRQPDGSPLTDSNGNVTSHLIGLFYRLTSLLKSGLKMIFVFDGVTPKLKSEEKQRRKNLKQEAQVKYTAAKESDDVEGMKKYAGRTAILTQEMIVESKAFLKALGIPVVQAPSEGEAQASFMVKKGDAYAIMSQDADSLLFGATKVVRNLSISQRRKKTSKLGYDKTEPEIITLSDVLLGLELSQDQLIILSMLVGTDYNVGGIKGVGPKNALKLVREYNNRFDELFNDLKWDDFFSHPWTEVFDLFIHPNVSDDYALEFIDPNKIEIKKILVTDHAFSEERVDSVLKDFIDSEARKQKGLSDFF